VCTRSILDDAQLSHCLSRSAVLERYLAIGGVSVCLRVTRWNWLKTNNRRIMRFTRTGITGNLAFIPYTVGQKLHNFIIAITKANTEHLLYCVYVTVMTFKAYVTAVMNKMPYVSFHKVQWEQPSGEVGIFVAVLLHIFLVHVCQKLSKYNVVWQSYSKNNKRSK